ncbi:MAG: hypothetical protein RLP09_01485 [Sandaracinaceae bacterium]
MDLVDKIERSRFLGREFLVWLWFESERLEGVLPLPSGEACELWLEEQLTLVADMEKAESKLKAGAPSATPEAKEALRQGKLPTKAKMRISRGPQSWSFLFNADSLAVAGVKIPALITEETDEKFYERMQLVEDLEAMIGGLYERFLEVRTSERWAQEADAVRAWVEA